MIGATPDRAAGSIRRTTTIDMTWPAGPRGDLHMDLRGRDLLSGEDPTDTTILAAESARFVLSFERLIESADAGPDRPWAPALGGHSSRRGFRRQLAAMAPASTSPLLLHLLDDLPGASIVSDFAVRQWGLYADVDRFGQPLAPQQVTGTCTGFAPGSTALNADGTSTGSHLTTRVSPLTTDDPVAWHDFPDTSAMAMRRARRIDVSVSGRSSGATIEIDAMFQDSCTLRDGGRSAVHEYDIRATADLDSGLLTSVTAAPGNLPYGECPFAANNIDRLVGTPVVDLRRGVATQLKGIAGCTHLNDALRALAAVPGLLGLKPAT
jgi:hypothetical protein